MQWLIYLLYASFILFGLFIILSNYLRQITNFKNRNIEGAKWSSPAPFVGPIFVIIGYSGLPFEFSSFIFFVIILDPDTLLTIFSIPYFIKGLLK